MNYLQKNIINIAEQVAERLGFLLVDVSLKGDNRNRIVEVFIDSLKGVSIDDCALMSHELAAVLETTDLITSKYRLDVSSPGVDRPLKYLEQYPKHLDRKFEVSYSSAKDDSGEETAEVRIISGKLTKIEGEVLTFRVNNEEIAINFNTIKTAKVLISF
ncbi:MAG: ribosome maturation factor RimP [Ignavibacteriales bacterium]